MIHWQILEIQACFSYYCFIRRPVVSYSAEKGQVELLTFSSTFCLTLIQVKLF